MEEVIDLIPMIGKDQSAAKRVNEIIFSDPITYIGEFIDYLNENDTFSVVVLLGRIISKFRADLMEVPDFANQLTESISNIIQNNPKYDTMKYSFIIMQYMYKLYPSCQDFVYQQLFDLASNSNLQIRICALSTISDLLDKGYHFECHELIPLLDIFSDDLNPYMDIYSKILIQIGYNCNEGISDILTQYLLFIQSNSIQISDLLHVFALYPGKSVFIFSNGGMFLIDEFLEILGDSTEKTSIRYNAYSILYAVVDQLKSEELIGSFMLTLFNIFIESNSNNLENPMNFLQPQDQTLAEMIGDSPKTGFHENKVIYKSCLEELFKTDGNSPEYVYAILSIANWGRHALETDTIIGLIEKYADYEEINFPIYYRIINLISLLSQSKIRDSEIIKHHFKIAIQYAHFLIPCGFCAIEFLFGKIDMSFFINNFEEIFEVLSNVIDNSISVFEGCDENDYNHLLALIWDQYINLFRIMIIKLEYSKADVKNYIDIVLEYLFDIYSNNVNTMSTSGILPIMKIFVEYYGYLPEENLVSIEEYLENIITQELSNEEVNQLRTILYLIHDKKVFDMENFFNFIINKACEPPEKLPIPIDYANDKEYLDEFYVNNDLGFAVNNSDYCTYIDIVKLIYIYLDNVEDYSVLVRIIDGMLGFQFTNYNWTYDFLTLFQSTGKIMLQNEDTAEEFVNVLTNSETPLSGKSFNSMVLLEPIIKLLKINEYGPFLDLCFNFIQEVAENDDFSNDKCQEAEHLGHCIAILNNNGIEFPFEPGDNFEEETAIVLKLMTQYYLFTFHPKESLNELVDVVNEYFDVDPSEYDESVFIHYILYATKVAKRITKMYPEESQQFIDGLAKAIDFCISFGEEEEDDEDLDYFCSSLLKKATYIIAEAMKSNNSYILEYNDLIPLFVKGVLTSYEKGVRPKELCDLLFVECLARYHDQFPSDNQELISYLIEIFEKAKKDNNIVLQKKILFYIHKSKQKK